MAVARKKVAKATKGTMTDISMMEKLTRPAQLKPSGPPRRRTDFADRFKQRQSDLTDQEVKLARRIWADHVEPMKEEFITLVFNEIFGKHPHLEDIFLRLELVGLPKLSIPETLVFKNYYLARVMVRLRDMMASLDNPKRLTMLMTKLGLLYVKTNVQLSSALFGDFQNAMVSTIKIAMNNQMHPQEESALRKCFELALSIMEEASLTYYDLFVAAQTAAKGKAKK